MIDREGNVRILDFGIARSMKGKGITGAGGAVGPPEYMSPEQVEGKEADERSDIYSLGVVLYEMLTGRVPFEGDTPFTVGVKQKSETPKNPKLLNPNIPDDLSGVILRCLEKHRQSRYPSAEVLAVDLDRVKSELPAAETIIPQRKSLTSREITVKFTPRKLIVPAIVFLAVAAAVGYLVLRPRPAKLPPLSTSGKPSLAVMYFENLSDQKDLDKSVVSLLTTNLSRYEEIVVLSQQRLFDIMKRLGKEDANIIDKKVATEVAKMAGVKTMVLGSIVKLGEKIRVSPQLMDVQTGSLVAIEPVDGTKIDDVFAMVDDLTAKIGARLGSISAAKKVKKLEIQDVTTSSFEAYLAYQEGTEKFWRWKFEEAQDLFQKAIDLDPTFAMAYLGLSQARSSFGLAFFNPYIDLSPVRKLLGLAKKYSARATDLERRMIDAWIAFSDLNVESIKPIMTGIVDEYPDEKTAYFLLGWVFWLEDNFSKAREAFEKILELDPTFANAYNALAYTNAFLKDRAGVISAARKYISINPDVMNAYDSAWKAYVIMGLFDDAFGIIEEAKKQDRDAAYWHYYAGYTFLLKRDAKRARQEFLSYSIKFPSSLAQNALCIGTSDMVEGRCQRAMEEFRGAVESARQKKDLSQERLARVNLGIMNAALKNYDEAIAEYSIAEGLSRQLDEEEFSPYMILAHYLTGVALIGKGDFEAASGQADAIKSMIQKGNYARLHSDYFHLLLGEIAVARRNIEVAQDELKAVLSSSRLFSPHYRRLEAQLASLQGYPDNSIEKLENSFENWSLGDFQDVPSHLFAFFQARSRLDYDIAILNEQAGKPEKALEHYERFLSLMKDADPGLPEVEDARKRLAGLKRE